MNKNESGIFKLGLILLIFTGISALMLSLVYSITRPIIEENDLKKEKENISIILPRVQSFDKEGDRYRIYSDKMKRNLIGYVFKTEAKGYGGPVVCQVGIDLFGQVTGVVVSSHSETPGLGSKIEEKKKGQAEPYFLLQFKKKTKDQIEGDIQALTGATISSKAVINCVKEAFKKYLAIRK
ncbi:MAG: RnfABCDGE type electron transport complex subunit G [Spirochaetes bacterium]|nr:RnfABCDGE type electron transport complex subunit G [Spirochaetota bacterium]